MRVFSDFLFVLGILSSYTNAKRLPPVSSPNNKLSNSSVRNYDIEFTKMRMEYINPDYLGPSTTIKLNGPNEISFRLEFVKDMPDDVKSIYQTFQKNAKNKVYSPSISVKSTVCDDYERDLKGIPFFKCYHYYDAGIKECPMKKGTYSMKKISCSSADGPPLVSGLYWRINNTWVTKGNILIANRLIELVILKKPNSKLPM